MKDEINALSGVINETLTRLESSFNQVRQFTTDASHELRTPIAIMKARIEVALSRKDGLLIRMLLLNLADNALKYTPSSGMTKVSLDKDNGCVKMVVEDNGMGISPEDIPHIFDRFYRSNNARTANHDSAGLGLSICQWIVKSHQGTITVESKLHKGSIFTVTLPTC